jgi:hypothetical protein
MSEDKDSLKSKGEGKKNNVEGEKNKKEEGLRSKGELMKKICVGKSKKE